MIFFLNSLLLNDEVIFDFQNSIVYVLNRINGYRWKI